MPGLAGLVAWAGALLPHGQSSPATFGSDGRPTSVLASLGTMLFPAVAYVAIAPVLWWFFRNTWRELDAEAHAQRGAALEAGVVNRRPAVLFAICALSLTMQEYYGGREFYEDHLRTWLVDLEVSQLWQPGGLGQFVHLRTYGELYWYGWWCFTRVAGYIFVPFVAWKAIFRHDSLLDMGLRVRGLLKHAWIYGLCIAVVLPIVFVVSRGPEFGLYYPFYKQCSRSWFDLLAWEALYFMQFFGLEIFFRGFWLSGLRSTLGSGAIFAMVVPYCMIHYGKPYFEACGAVIAGIALGSLAMRTRSIYSGFFVHITIALSMDLLALANHGGLPSTFWPPPG